MLRGKPARIGDLLKETQSPTVWVADNSAKSRACLRVSSIVTRPIFGTSRQGVQVDSGPRHRSRLSRAREGSFALAAGTDGQTRTDIDPLQARHLPLPSLPRRIYGGERYLFEPGRGESYDLDSSRRSAGYADCGTCQARRVNF